MTPRLLLAALVVALAIVGAVTILAVDSTATAGQSTQVSPPPPPFWTPLPQPPSGRTGVYQACIDGRRVLLAEGGPNSSPALAVSPVAVYC